MDMVIEVDDKDVGNPDPIVNNDQVLNPPTEDPIINDRDVSVSRPGFATGLL